MFETFSRRQFAKLAGLAALGMATPAISANGAKDGIVWVIETGGMAVLHAYDATNVANELYDSRAAAGSRDGTAPALHFTIPTVAGGRVYVPAAGEVEVFGLLNQRSTTK